jgi:hypothetical protein
MKAYDTGIEGVGVCIRVINRGWFAYIGVRRLVQDCRYTLVYNIGFSMGEYAPL